MLHNGYVGTVFGPKIAYRYFSCLLQRDLNTLCVWYDTDTNLFFVREDELRWRVDSQEGGIVILDTLAVDPVDRRTAFDVIHQYYAGPPRIEFRNSDFSGGYINVIALYAIGPKSPGLPLVDAASMYRPHPAPRLDVDHWEDVPAWMEQLATFRVILMVRE